MIRRFPGVALAFLLFISVGTGAAERPAFTPPTADSLGRDVHMLAGPAMEGRGPGTPGGERAAGEIARILAAAGLRPGGDQQSFFQSFAFATGTRLAPASRFEVLGSDARTLSVDREWRPHGGSRQGEVTGDVIFVGHGITTPDGRWDDYRSVDVRGRIALALDGAPAELGARVTSRLDKLLAARRAGATALLLASDALPPLEETGARVDILSASVTRSAAEALRASGPRSVRMRIALETTERRTANVIGILPGRDPALAHEAVVIGAHHDHLGMSGGQIYHGADDNASGTAAVLGLARAFAAAGGAPRTLVFALFGAEELGLLGSAHYVRHPAVPLERTVAMVNLDMVGRLRGSVTVGGVDTGSGMRAIVNDASIATGVPVTMRGESQPASDHSSFYHAGKPVVFFHTQGHDDYHKPTDTADKIDVDGLARVTALAAAVVERLAAAPPPTYAKVESSARRSRSPRASVPAGGAFLGIAGDGGRRGDGVPLRQVVPGSAAEKAGVRAGDVLVRFGGEIVDGFEDVQRLVAARKPGDTVELVYLRNGEERTASAALGVRPEN